MGKTREIFISADAQETRVAVTEEKRLEEFNVERSTDTRMVIRPLSSMLCANSPKNICFIKHSC